MNPEQELRKKLWLKVFEIIEANIHQWQERKEGTMPKVMTSVNSEKMRDELVEYISKKALPELAKEAGYVKLAEDQSLPGGIFTCDYSLEQLLKDWARVITEKKEVDHDHRQGYQKIRRYNVSCSCYAPKT